MKKAIYIFIIGIGLMGTRASANDKSAAQRAKELTYSMNCELELRAGQLPIINAINLKASLKMDSLDIVFKDDYKGYRKAGAEIDKERDLQLRDALTPSQFSVYERISKGNHHAIRESAGCRKNWRIDEKSCNF